MILNIIDGNNFSFASNYSNEHNDATDHQLAQWMPIRRSAWTNVKSVWSWILVAWWDRNGGDSGGHFTRKIVAFSAPKTSKN
uniref:Uncharacterized protein n=1 Tax=Romanomermis culicivorax TaxID=13658 RepID=A0A915J119_ROMCU